MIVRGYLFTYLYLILLLLITDILHKKFNVSEMITRKVIHICVSFCWIIFYVYFKNTIHIIIPPITFIIVNYISYKKNLFKGMENDDNSIGTVLYPVSVLIMCIVTYFEPKFYLPFGIGLFIMAFGDGLAPLVAKKIRSKKLINNKTISGSLTVFVVSILVMLTFDLVFDISFKLYQYVIVAIISTLLELIGTKGLDNLYIPLGVSIIVYLMGVL